MVPSVLHVHNALQIYICIFACEVVVLYSNTTGRENGIRQAGNHKDVIALDSSNDQILQDDYQYSRSLRFMTS